MFNSRLYWEQRYKNGDNSGSGSYGNLVTFKADAINDFIANYSIHKVIDWGCGDGNLCRMIKCDEYLGFDVSATTVDNCTRELGNEKRKFICYDGGLIDVQEKGDICLSIDVIFHLVEDDVYENYMHNPFNNSQKYVCIYSFDGEIKNTANHVKYRKFSELISMKFPHVKLIKYVKNQYPRKKNSSPETTSWCDFYFYEV